MYCWDNPRKSSKWSSKEFPKSFADSSMQKVLSSIQVAMKMTEIFKMYITGKTLWPYSQRLHPHSTRWLCHLWTLCTEGYVCLLHMCIRWVPGSRQMATSYRQQRMLILNFMSLELFNTMLKSSRLHKLYPIFAHIRIMCDRCAVSNRMFRVWGPGNIISLSFETLPSVARTCVVLQLLGFASGPITVQELAT